MEYSTILITEMFLARTLFLNENSEKRKDYTEYNHTPDNPVAIWSSEIKKEKEILDWFIGLGLSQNYVDQRKKRSQWGNPLQNDGGNIEIMNKSTLWASARFWKFNLSTLINILSKPQSISIIVSIIPESIICKTWVVAKLCGLIPPYVRKRA